MQINRRFFLICLGLLFYNLSYSQSLYLIVEADSEKHTAIIDSIGYKTTFKNYNALKKEVDSAKYRLNRLGYIDTFLNVITKTNDSLFTANLILGKKIKTIKIYYDTTFDTSLLNFITHKLGEDYFEIDIDRLETSLNTLNTKIAEQGDPFSSLQLVHIKKEAIHLISAHLKITTNKKRRIDRIIVKGYEKFPKSYLKRFLGLRKNKVFNLNAIRKKIALIEELPFAKNLREPEVLFTNDSTTLYLYLEKTRTNNFDGFLGFGTNEETNKLEFDGYLDLRLINNLNFGEVLNLYYKSDEIDQQTFRVDATLPYIFKSPVGLELGLNIFRKDSTFLNATQKANINYQINARHRVSAGISNVVSSNLLEQDTDILNDYTSNYYSIRYNYNRPQYYDPLFPINFWFDFSSGFGNRSSDLETLSQTVFNLETYKIFNLNKRNSVFTRFTGAFLDSDAYLDNELFRFGGINSIRGFEENSLVANLYGVINTEYRYRLSSSIYVHSVIDAAYFENQIIDTKQKLFGFGFGFGLLTNSGLFRFNYTTAKTENSPVRLSDSKIHVSLTATF